jgi:hypothetical protein
MSFEPGPDGKLYLGYHNDVIPQLDREERDRLRAELDGMTETLNRALAEGWRVVKFDYVVQIERGGYSLLVELER